jgi:hypothetical protein
MGGVPELRQWTLLAPRHHTIGAARDSKGDRSFGSRFGERPVVDDDWLVELAGKQSHAGNHLGAARLRREVEKPGGTGLGSHSRSK